MISVSYRRSSVWVTFIVLALLSSYVGSPSSGEAAASLVVNTLVDEMGTETGTGLKCSLREAIIANNSRSDFGGCADPQGTIAFETELAGTITITNSALPQITQNVEIKGPGSSTLAVSGNNQFRVFDIGSNLNVTIDGLTITKGSISGYGGGIQATTGTTVTVVNSTLSGNSAKNGGGILASIATVSRSTLSGNSAKYAGGGVLAGAAMVSDSTLSGNSAYAGGGIFASTATVNDSILSGNSAENHGGGVFADISAKVSDSTLNGNSANNGGGISAFLSRATVSRSTLSGNSAENGGGIFAYDVILNNSTLSENTARVGAGGIGANTATVSDSTLSGNSAESKGGGISAYYAILNNSTLSGNSAGVSGGGIDVFLIAKVSNSTLSGNRAGDKGGGIHVYQGTATVSHSTLSGNSAGVSGGGITSPRATVNSTIISGNIAPANSECMTEPDISGSNNIIGVSSNAGGCGFAGVIPSGTLDTILNPLANNGGFSSGAPGSTIQVLTHSLPPNSPATNAGNPAFVSPPDFDQRGHGFRRIVGGTVDIGSFEVQLD